jgi:ABC-type phosphate transport system ATPase subunit
MFLFIFFNAQVLLLDEPTSALDPVATANIEDVVMSLSRKGLTIIIVSHSLKQIQRIASIVCVLVKGEVVEISKPNELGSSNHPVIKQFIEAS